MNTNKPDLFDRIMLLPVFKPFSNIYKKNKTVLLYAFFGGLTTLISIGSFALFHAYLHINELVSNIISWAGSVSFAYITNKTWVFKSMAKGKASLSEAFSFFAGRLATLAVEEIILFAFVTVMCFNGVIVKTAAQFLVLVLNYLISKIIVFRKREM